MHTSEIVEPSEDELDEIHKYFIYIFNVSIFYIMFAFFNDVCIIAMFIIFNVVTFKNNTFIYYASLLSQIQSSPKFLHIQDMATKYLDD